MFSPQKPIALSATERTQDTDAFCSTEQAWFWTMAALAARRDGLSRPLDTARRSIVPEDVLRCLDGLYRQRRIDLLHARILRVWGERGRAPDPARRSERGDAAIWREAIGRLDWPLRVKGLVRVPSEF